MKTTTKINNKITEVWMPNDKDYMSILRIGYKSKNPLDTIIDLLSEHVITWDCIRYLIQDVDWSGVNVENRKQHSMYVLEEEEELFLNTLSDIKGHHETESVTFRCRFAYFATRITHLWYNPLKNKETEIYGGHCLHPLGQICAYIGVNNPVSYIWLEVCPKRGIPNIVGSNVNNSAIPLRLELHIQDLPKSQRISLDLKNSKVYNSIRGEFIQMHILKSRNSSSSSSSSNNKNNLLFDNVVFKRGVQNRSFLLIITFGKDHVYQSTWYNDKNSGNIEAYPVSLHPLYVDIF